MRSFLHRIASRTTRTRAAPHARSFAFGVLEQVFHPLLMFLSTPIFIAAIGKEYFGLWLLLASVVALVSVAGFGMAMATTKFVAEYRGRGDAGEVAAIVRHTLAFSLAGALVIAAPIALAAPWLATNVFAKMGEPAMVTMVLWIGAFVIVLAQIDATFLAALRGYERFGTVATLEALLKIVTISLLLVVAMLTKSFVAVMAGTLVLGLAATLLRALLARRIVGPGLWRPRWSKRHARSVWTFGGWNWLNTMSSILFVHVDRFVVGSALGASALAQYGICLQLASQVHAIPAAGMAFLLPVVSRKLGQGGSAAVNSARAALVLLGAAIAGVLALVLVFFGTAILDLWVGREIRVAIAEPFPLAVACYFLLAVNIGAYFVLLGQGDARFVSAVSLAAGIVAAAASFLLIPRFGLAGGIVAKSIYSVAMLALVARVFRCGPRARIAPATS